MVRMFSFIIPLSLATVTVLCRKERQSSLKLCRGRKVRKLPMYKKRGANLHTPAFLCRQGAILCRLFFLREDVKELQKGGLLYLWAIGL
jgi:hypothetical protein